MRVFIVRAPLIISVSTVYILSALCDIESAAQLLWASVSH